MAVAPWYRCGGGEEDRRTGTCAAVTEGRSMRTVQEQCLLRGLISGRLHD